MGEAEVGGAGAGVPEKGRSNLSLRKRRKNGNKVLRRILVGSKKGDWV